ncbi:MAG: DUF3800 domain-containing protein [Candidatus Omnitrophota bacterium]
MVYLYLDESGDLGFDFVNKRPSRYFTVTVVAVYGQHDRKRLIKMVQRTLRKKINPKNKRRRFVKELKGMETTLEVKKFFYSKIQSLKFKIYSITLNKRRVFPNLIQDKSRVYNWVARLLLDRIDFNDANTCIHLVIDKSKSKPAIEEFNCYIKDQLKGRIDPNIPLHINHEDSCQDLGLNAADLFSWGVFRKYERKDKEWFDVFKEKVVYDDVYLP